LLNGRVLNLSYGSYAPARPMFSLTTRIFKELWSTPERYYWWRTSMPFPSATAGRRENLNIVAECGGKFLFHQLPLPNSTLPPDVADAQRVLPIRADVISGRLSVIITGPAVDFNTLAHKFRASEILQACRKPGIF